MEPSYADKEHWILLNRLVKWRKSKLQIYEIQKELTKRHVDFHPTAVKGDLAELLRQTLERQLQHIPLALSKIRTIQMEVLDCGRNKDGYNKKNLISKLRSQDLRTSGTKIQMRARLKQAMQLEKRGFDAKWAEMKAKKAAASATTGPPRQGYGVTPNKYAEPPSVAAAAAASEKWKLSNKYAVEQEKQHIIEANTTRISVPYPEVSEQPIAAYSFSQSSTALTAEQRQRIEANRERALQRKRKADSLTTTLTPQQKQRVEANRHRALGLQAAASASDSKPQSSASLLPLTPQQKQRVEANRHRALGLQAAPASAFASKPQSSASLLVLTPEQKQRVEANHQRALQLRAASASKPYFSFSFTTNHHTRTAALLYRSQSSSKSGTASSSIGVR